MATPFSDNFFPQICKMLQTYFFKLLQGDFSNLHKTLHTASVDPPDKKLIKEHEVLHISTLIWLNDSGDYVPMSPWGSVQNFGTWPLGDAV